MSQIAHLQQRKVNPVVSPHRGRNGLGRQVACSQESTVGQVAVDKEIGTDYTALVLMNRVIR
jgi:hypothetical protein